MKNKVERIPEIHISQENQKSEVIELKINSIRKSDSIDAALTDLEKAKFLLNHWIDEYEFSEKPDARLAVDFCKKVPGDHIRKEQDSFKWYWEYNNICKLISMAYDYVLIAENTLTKEKRDEQNRKIQH